MNKIWLAMLLVICLLSCKKDYLETKKSGDTNLPPVTNLPVTLILDESSPGYTIPEKFEGLSYETGLLGQDPDFLNENNKVLVQLIKNLGPGLLRIGGNTSDLTNWTGTARTDKTPKRSLTTSDIDRLSAFSKAIGWPVLFGLNLGNNNPRSAAYEAKYVHRSLNGRLYAFQSGNEPDAFMLGARTKGYTYDNYQQEWENYFVAVRHQVHEVPFAGPDITNNIKWLNQFADHENKNVKLIDGHYYATGPASVPSINCESILTPDAKLPVYLGSLQTESAKYHLPFRISEGNSVYGGGKKGVSDVFASTLWALDFMWNVAEYKGAGVNFHGGGSFFAYSPIAPENGTFVAKPEYYSMLAFKYGAVGQTIIPTTLSHPGYNISAHACVKADGAYTITIINKETVSSFDFSIQFHRSMSNGEVARLTAPDVTSAAGITFAGSVVSDDGQFQPDITEKFLVNAKNFLINIPPGSAAVVTVRP